MNMQKTTILFDYGGTLDTGGLHWGYVFWNVYHRFIPNLDYDAYRKVYVMTEKRLGTNNIISENTSFYEVLKIKIDHHFLLLKEDNRIDTEVDDKCKQDVLEVIYGNVLAETAKSKDVLSKLKDSFQLALVSNFYGNLQQVLKEFTLDEMFDLVVESAKVGIRKPDSKIFQFAIEQLHSSANSCYVIGDSMKNDIIPAKKIGCKTIWIKGKSWNEGEEDVAKADFIITNLTELEQIFQ